VKGAMSAGLPITKLQISFDVRDFVDLSAL
jgi:hypothetical protein